MRFEFLIVCSSAAPSDYELRQVLLTALSANLNELDEFELFEALKITHLRQCPATPNATNQEAREICCFAVELAEDTKNVAQVINDFCSALDQIENLKHVLKFFDTR